MSDTKVDISLARIEWSTPQKNRIKIFHEEASWSKKAIAKVLSIPQTTHVGDQKNGSSEQ